jgi:hypothetical protein
MAPPRQLEFFPPKKRTAAERRALIHKRLEGLEYRQQAREERRREQLERRRARQGADIRQEPSPQVTIEEMIERLSAQS